MNIESEAVNHLDPLVAVTTIWDEEVVEKPLSEANRLWYHTTRDNLYPRAFLDEFIQKIIKDGGVCKTDSFQRAVRTEQPEGYELREDDWETETNQNGRLVFTKTRRIQKHAKKYRVQGNELHYKGEDDVLRLVPATDMKHHNWHALFKKEAVAACACSQKASKAVWVRTISLHIANEFKVDVAPYENIIRENLVEIMKLGNCKCNWIRVVVNV